MTLCNSPRTGQKAERELRHLRRFRECLTGFPEGSICHQEKPDFLVRTESKVIGIEHTELLKVTGRRGGSALKAQESLWEKVTALVRERLLQEEVPFMHVRIYQRKDIPLVRSRQRELAQEICELAKRHLPAEEGSSRRTRLSQCRAALPDEVREIELRTYPRFTRHYCSSSLSGAAPILPESYIRQAISEKEDKLDVYRACCQEVWLLIIVEGAAPSSFWEIPPDLAYPKLHTAFDKAFILFYVEGELIELNRQIPSETPRE